MKRHLIVCLAGIALLCGYAAVAVAEASSDSVLGTWVTEGGKSRVEIAKDKAGRYVGKITWLKEPDYPEDHPEEIDRGKPKHDRFNPDKSKRSQPIIGLTVLKDFKYDGDGVWSGGTIYDPENGKTYKCKMTLEGKTLHVRGFIGISLIGRTTDWKQYEPKKDQDTTAGQVTDTPAG